MCFQGHFNYPPLFQDEGYNILSLELVVKNNLDDQESRVHVKKVASPDLAQKYTGNKLLQEAGYEGVFKVDKNSTYHDKTYYKFYLELTLREGRFF